MNANDFGSHVGGRHRKRERREDVAENACPRLGLAQWALIEEGAYQPCHRTRSRLPAGAYAMSLHGDGSLELRVRDLRVDDLLDFAGSTMAGVVQEIECFWKLQERYHRLGYRHSRGYLFYGPQG